MQIIINEPRLNPAVHRLVFEFSNIHGPINRIRIIKSVRAVLQIGLKEAKELVEVVLDDRPLTDTCLVG